MKKRLYKFSPLIIIGILIITNPSISAFKVYRGAESYEGLKRPLNLFILSEYKIRSHKYIGIFGNFIDIGYSHSYFDTPSATPTLDSTKNIDSSRVDTSQSISYDTHR